MNIYCMAGYGARKLIVGVDPGLNCGLAILTLDGEPILVESHRGWSLSKIIERIISFGETTIVSSDVSPAPSLLERLSRKLNAVLFEPAISMSIEEKHRLTKLYAERYNVKIENAHELDALAAAIKAYQHYKSKFEQVDAKLKEIGDEISPNDVKDLVARGYSISRAIKALKDKGSEKPPILGPVISTEEKMREIIENLTRRLMLERERNRILREANRELHLKIRALETEVESLRNALEKVRSEQVLQIRREREYRKLYEEIRVLRDKIAEQEAQIEAYRQALSRLQSLSGSESREGLILLKPIESFTREGLDKSFKLYNIKVGDLVYIMDPSGGGSSTAENLAKRGIKAVIINGTMSHQALEIFEKYHISVVPASELNIRWIDGLPYADPNDIKRLIKEGKTISSVSNVESLKDIVRDYLREIMRWED
ncbi:DUF460 domain-containing protein [Candidatus Bathyarchaeota archaeon]|nr:DUF460 domain-containing protein [Candidatus Bathyarchaeota archaeon]